MPKTYEQLLKQIDTLQQQAEALRRKELSGVVARIQVAVKAYGLTAADLGFGVAGSAAPTRDVAAAKKRRGPTKGKPAFKTKSKLSTEAKFRNEAGQGWVGRGKRPQWLRDALASGKTLADFKV